MASNKQQNSHQTSLVLTKKIIILELQN